MGRWFRADNGATMVEYSVMVVLIAAVSIGVVRLIGVDVFGLFKTVADAF